MKRYIKKTLKAGIKKVIKNNPIKKTSKNKAAKGVKKKIVSTAKSSSLRASKTSSNKMKAGNGTLQARGLLQTVAEQKLSSLIQSISDEIWFADINGKFTLANPAALNEFELSGKELDIEDFAASLEVYRPDGSLRPIDEAPPLRALKGEIVRNQEEIIRTPKKMNCVIVR